MSCLCLFDSLWRRNSRLLCSLSFGADALLPERQHTARPAFLSHFVAPALRSTFLGTGSSHSTPREAGSTILFVLHCFFLFYLCLVPRTVARSLSFHSGLQPPSSSPHSHPYNTHVSASTVGLFSVSATFVRSIHPSVRPSVRLIPIQSWSRSLSPRRGLYSNIRIYSRARPLASSFASASSLTVTSRLSVSCLTTTIQSPMLCLYRCSLRFPLFYVLHISSVYVFAIRLSQPQPCITVIASHSVVVPYSITPQHQLPSYLQLSSVPSAPTRACRPTCSSVHRRCEVHMRVVCTSRSSAATWSGPRCMHAQNKGKVLTRREPGVRKVIV